MKLKSFIVRHFRRMGMILNGNDSYYKIQEAKMGITHGTNTREIPRNHNEIDRGKETKTDTARTEDTPR